jgi:hypothetical protein
VLALFAIAEAFMLKPERYAVRLTNQERRLPYMGMTTTQRGS